MRNSYKSAETFKKVPHFNRSASNMSVPNVLIVGWKGMILEVVRNLIGDEEGIKILDTAETLEDAMNLMKVTRPDVVITGITPLELDPATLIARIESELNTKIPVLVLTLYEEPSVILNVMASGASGYLILSKTKRQELISAVYSARNNQIVLGSQAWSILNGIIFDKVYGIRGLDMPSLSTRELEVLQLLAEGLSNKEIANRLSIGKRTVQVHVAHVLSKLGVSSRSGAVSFALRRLLGGNPAVDFPNITSSLS